jgi:pyruvate dehydrogenase (quinone)
MLVAIVGQVARESMGGRYQQEVDLPNLFKDVAGSFVGVAADPAQIRHLVDRAFRIALAERTVTCLIVPHDVQSLEAETDPPREHGMQHSSPGYATPRVVPADDELRRAAGVLNECQRVAILAGAGALGVPEELVATADLLCAGIAKALLGRTVVPDDLPFVAGSIGWLGTSASNRMMERCDTLLMVGTGFPYTEFLPSPGAARAVQIDISAGKLGVRYPTEVNLQGDSAATLRALMPLLQRKTDRTWRAEIEAAVAEWWHEAERRAMEPADPLNAQLLFHELSRRLPDDCILTADSGTSTVWYAPNLRLRRGMQASVSGTLATMGCAIPYALAAKLAHPDRPVIALLGDGAMQMNSLTELVTVAHSWQTWSDPRLVMLVLNNRDLGFVTWEQRAMEGEPRFEASQHVPDFPYGQYAEMLGLRGSAVQAPEEVGLAWDEALAADRPVVINAVVDPNVPTLPPQPPEQVIEKIARALAAEPVPEAVRGYLEREGVFV